MLKVLTLFTLLSAGNAAAAELRACLSDVDLPPFSYRQTNKPGYLGYSLDVLQLLAKDNGHQLRRIDRLPWRRCLSLLQQGHYHLALNARSNQFEDSDLQASKPLYQLHYLYFYSRQRFPQGLKLQSITELPKYRLCALNGLGYEMFGIDIQRVDSGAGSYSALIGKLHHQRCDLFVEAREVIAGHLLLDPGLSGQLQDPRLDEAPLPASVAGNGLYLLYNRNTDNQLGLLSSFNRTLDSLQNNGTLAKLMMRYLR